jgi:hypothetical protein
MGSLEPMQISVFEQGSQPTTQKILVEKVRWLLLRMNAMIRIPHNKSRNLANDITILAKILAERLG